MSDFLYKKIIVKLKRNIYSIKNSKLQFRDNKTF